MQPDVHFQVLEIEPGASKDDIKQAYKDLAKVWHPDRFSEVLRLQKKAEDKLKRINTAYEFLKSYQPHAAQTQAKPQPQANQPKAEPKQEQSPVVLLNCEKLENLLELGRLKEADYETKRLLLELADREKDGWLRPEDIKSLPSHALSVIDNLWTQHSNGRFGFSAQKKIWHKLGCKTSSNTGIQTISENKFGQSVQWRKSSLWLTPWESFSYDIHTPEGSLPREYIFTLSGWWSYSHGWIGQLLLRFDDIFLKL